MAATKRKTSSADAEPARGVLWYLMPGGVPVRASQARGDAAGLATAWCHEGDAAWSRIRPPANDLDTTGGTAP